MEYRATNKIEVVDSDENTLLSILSKTYGSDSSTNEFIVNNFSSRTFSINISKAVSIPPIDILSELGISLSALTSLFIVIRDVDYLTTNNNTLSIKLKLGSVEMVGSEFYFLKLSELNERPVISEITCLTGYTGTLTIVGTENQDISTSI